MSNNIKTFVFQTYEIFKRDFWILIGMNILGTLLINFLFKPHEVVVFLVVAIMVFKNLSFVRGSSIMPSVSSDFDRFSWKYYMGIPLNKKELIISLVLTNLIVMLPVFVGVFCFFPQIVQVFSFEPSKTSWSFYVKAFFLLVAFFSYTSLSSIKQQIINPRKKYSKISPKILFLQRLKRFLLIITIVGYSFAGLDYLDQFYTFDFSPYFKWVKPTLTFIFNTWAIIPSAFVLILIMNFKLLKAWQNENKGYIKNSWIPKRDFPLVSACATAIILPFFILESDVPKLFQGTELNRAVYLKDEQEVTRLISQGKNFNQPNRYGITPVMLAVIGGNIKMLHLLEKHKASYAGKIINSRNEYESSYHNGMNALHLAVQTGKPFIVSNVLHHMSSLAYQPDILGNLPIHLAAKECNTEILDNVLEGYDDINVKNATGKTALHMAVYANCFASVDLLVSKNIDVSIRDNDGKLAIQYKNESIASKSEQYMLEKKLRAPASEK